MTAPTTASIAELLCAEWSGLPPRTRLPSDRALAERFDVGHGVIGRIMADLERQGLVRRQRGSGSFWLGDMVSVAVTTPPSFAHLIRNAGLTPGSTLLSVETRRVATTERKHLRLSPNTAVWCIRRLLTVERIPVGVATSVLPARDLKALPAELESYGSLFDTLDRRYHRPVVRAWKRQRPVELPRFVGEVFGLQTPISVELQESLNRVVDGAPIEYARTYMRTDALNPHALIRRAHGVRLPQQEASRRCR
ncbi:GntR family transcriptional regulator [Streptomyces carpinensis]|uniref:GntR family transcriptional regulator n=1 Tax=Streptomyces carpinensis TaxID=66369 RepID=A0ABV1W6V9_9ACTN|nr:GntR family transcriptional regulator [Streptomyces carpinensis]